MICDTTEPQWLTHAKENNIFVMGKLKYHSSTLYEPVLEKFKDKITEFIDCGGHSAVFELNDNTVLKLSYQPLKPEYGKRPFDLPILNRGERESVVDYKKRKAYWHIQPRIEMCTSEKELEEFKKTLKKTDHYFIDSNPRQIGWYKRKIKLVDYPSVWPPIPNTKKDDPIEPIDMPLLGLS